MKFYSDEFSYKIVWPLSREMISIPSRILAAFILLYLIQLPKSAFSRYHLDTGMGRGGEGGRGGMRGGGEEAIAHATRHYTSKTINIL